jgi:hypothetical protein
LNYEGFESVHCKKKDSGMTRNAFHDMFSDYLTSAGVLPCQYKKIGSGSE